MDGYYYASDRSLSSEQGMSTDPYFFTNMVKRREEEYKIYTKRRAKVKRKRANNQKKLLVQEAKIGKEDPEAKKPRADGN
jgi:hypothetical protein